jgi:hypothetical protein
MTKRWIWIAFIILMILHHDWWFWNNGYLLFGFLPIGLAYHALISLLAGTLWALTIFYAWPVGLEQEINTTKNEPNL